MTREEEDCQTAKRHTVTLQSTLDPKLLCTPRKSAGLESEGRAAFLM